MSASFTDPEIPPIQGQPAPPRCRSWAWLAWLVIIGLCGLMVLGRSETEDRKAEKESNLAGIMLKFQARYLVGAKNVLPHDGYFQAALQLRKGGVDERLRFVVLANELAGPKESLKQLDLLDNDMADHKVKPTPDQARLRILLGRLFQDYSQKNWKGPSLTSKDRDFVRQHLDWFGDLALSPGGMAAGEVAPAADGPGAVAVFQAQQAARSATLVPRNRTFI